MNPQKISGKFNLSFDIFHECSVCGEELEVVSECDDCDGEPYFTIQIKPCEECKKKEKEKVMKTLFIYTCTDTDCKNRRKAEP